MSVQFIEREAGQKLAYVHVKASASSLPAVMFLGGFKSDMEGTKALFLQNLCEKGGREFVRFDYSGHGQSDGAFTDGTVGSWAEDALYVLDHVVKEDVILVGSSMGGWIALLLMLKRSERLKGVIGIAAAPDFTRDIESRMNHDERRMMEQQDRIEVPNEYSDEPYIFTRALLEDGEQNSLLDRDHQIDVPMVLLQGKLDASVEWSKALEIERCFQGPNTRVIMIDDGDHSLSREQDLELLRQALDAI